jgi:uncharacterized damage-inducible protein DinB
METDQLLETWDVHNRINLYLLDAISPESLSDTPAPKGRNVGEQFAHLHNVRLMWLKSAAPELLTELVKIEKDAPAGKAALRQSLEGSGRAIRDLLAKSAKEGGRVKGFKPHAAAFLGYLVSHESHHRGQIVLTLKQAGHPPEKKILFGLWEWGVR